MRSFLNIKAENFLSLRKVDVRLDALNVLVGRTARASRTCSSCFDFWVMWREAIWGQQSKIWVTLNNCSSARIRNIYREK